jgi:adenylate kinase family enzyme
MKIQVCGYSGSGKSTFAKRLGEIYNIKVLHIDTINFGPNWVERDSSVINNEIEDFINCDEWIIDGNYVKHVSERFDLCDQFFFLILIVLSAYMVQ